MPESSRDEIAKLEALYANNPEGRVFTHLAEAYRRAGELERARNILEEGLTRHAGYASAHVVLGRVLMDEQKPEEAADAFRRVVGLDPHNHVALRSLGEIARSAGRNEEALQYFDELRHIDPNNEDVQRHIAELTAAASAPPESYEEPEMGYEEPAAAEAPPVAESAPEPDSEPQPEPEPEPAASQSNEMDMGWVPQQSDQLPGDLAELAGFAVTDFEDLGYDQPDPLAELTSMNLQTSEPADEDAGAAMPFESLEFEDMNFDASASEAEEATEQPEPFAPAPEETAPFEPEPFEPWEAPPATYEAEPVMEATPAESEPVMEATPAESEPEPAGEATGAEPEPEPFVTGVPEAFEPEAEPEPTGEVLTETIAELYRSQGLYDRAAEVYRALLKARPDDANLQEKLNEVEAEAAGPLPTFESEPLPEPLPAFTPEAAPEPMSTFMPEPQDDEAEAWLAGRGGIAESAPTPYAWTEKQPVAEPDGGPAISDYFQRLLSWQPTAAPSAPEAPAASFTPPTDERTVGSGMPDVEMEPDTMLLLDEAVETEEVGTAGFYDVHAPEAPVEAPADDPWMAAEPPAIEEPWESPMPPQAAAVEVPPQTEPPAPQPVSTADNAGDAFDEWFGVPEPPAPTPAPPAPAPAPPSDPGQASEDDDDLEMFRSWLQSLKK